VIVSQSNEKPGGSDAGDAERPHTEETTPVIIKSQELPDEQAESAGAVRGLHIMSPQVPFEIVEADLSDERTWSRSVSIAKGMLTDMTIREGDNLIDVPLGVLKASSVLLEFDSGPGSVTFTADSPDEKLSIVASGSDFQATVDGAQKLPYWVLSHNKSHGEITQISVLNSAGTELFRYTCAGRLPQVELFFVRS
jgi:hypothetical protein